MKDIDLEPDHVREIGVEPPPRQRRTFKLWLFGDAEQWAEEKKKWGGIGSGVMMGLVWFWWHHH